MVLNTLSKWSVLALGVFLAFNTTPAFSASNSVCKKSHVYFDLGDTLVDTKTYGFDPVFYLPGAAELLDQLAKKGHPLGLITDVPVTWGDAYPIASPIRDRDSAQVLHLIDFVDGRIPDSGASWRAGDEPFQWNYFGSFTGTGTNRVFHGRILLPHALEERKDTGNPVLFVRALEIAQQSHCSAVYLSEDPVQLEVARQAGFSVFLVRFEAGLPVFPSVQQIEAVGARSQRN